MYWQENDHGRIERDGRDGWWLESFENGVKSRVIGAAREVYVFSQDYDDAAARGVYLGLISVSRLGEAFREEPPVVRFCANGVGANYTAQGRREDFCRTITPRDPRAGVSPPRAGGATIPPIR